MWFLNGREIEISQNQSELGERSVFDGAEFFDLNNEGHYSYYITKQLDF